LEEAKNLGDVFIVGINGDDSIKRNKGESRPYNKLEYRLKQLEMLSIVDFIVVFDDDTPIELIKLIRPDILVKGGDYKIENIIGKEYVGETMVLSYVDGISSTKLIESIE
jgi:D-beta-D-heptose 7-phosphate kinase/D-beta-D-heptose 1-phosphate adenosyltransferase